MTQSNDTRIRIEEERAYLLRYATLQLRDRSAAEDAVQETLLAALASQAPFEGRSKVRTWLTGILKHKIVDAMRRASKEAPLPEESGGTPDFDALFESDGHWRDAPPAWQNPDAALEEKRFFAALEVCLARLPAKTAQVFMMREHMGVDTGDICKEIGITPTHCWVLLYRARMALRQCLEETWFGAKEPQRR